MPLWYWLLNPFINSIMVTPAGFEPAIAGLRTRSPRPLDEGANIYIVWHLIIAVKQGK